jgi:nitrite reductase (NADH) large subunit
MGYVIIGNGIAGVTAAETIRRCDPDGEIVLVADEASPPYCRPMISMVLEGAASPARLSIRGPDFYERLRISPVLGRRVSSLDPEARTLSLPDGNGGQTTLSYDRLLIATGADPRPVRAENRALDGIFSMRTEAQVRGMLETLPRVRNALVLGGGLVGFKAAYGLLRRGLPVTMLIRSGFPLSMQADETAGLMIRDELVRRGLDVRTGLEVRAFEGDAAGQLVRAHLSDGTSIPCEICVIGKGVLPALDFVPRDKIPVDLGLVVNERMETGAPGIFAAGDAAEFSDIARGTRWVNAIWPEAAATGRIAGMNMAGRRVACRGTLSRNVIRIFDLDVLTGGLVNPPPDSDEFRVLFRSDSRRRIYRKLVLREDRIVGLVMVGKVEAGGVLLSLMADRTPVRGDARRFLEPSFGPARAAG